jgi:regulator of protease activity HflC (stomatin/prohibitin superfamily)
MDILHLVDRLENVVRESRTMPLSRKLLLDEEKLIDIIDQMRVSVPDVVKQAQKVTAERDRQLAQAKEEAARIKQLAKAESQLIIEKDQITKDAHIRAKNIIEDAHRQSAKIYSDADKYVIDKFNLMERHLLSVVKQVRNGIQILQAPDDTKESPSQEKSA